MVSVLGSEAEPHSYSVFFRHSGGQGSGLPADRASIVSWPCFFFVAVYNSNQLLLSFHPASAARRSNSRGRRTAKEGITCSFWVSLTYKISNEGAVKVGDLLHASRDVGGSRGTTGVTIGLFFVVVITKDKAQQESGHHNVSDAQHREVTASGAET